MNITKISKKGFTLVELLVVMMIIGLLAGISIFGLQGARESGRDGRRKADLESIRSALELYKSDCGMYPDNLPSSGSPLTDGASPCPDPVGNTYIEEVPEDPDGGDYDYSSSGTTYCLCADLEVDPDTPDTSCSASCDYVVTNP